MFRFQYEVLEKHENYVVFSGLEKKSAIFPCQTILHLAA